MFLFLVLEKIEVGLTNQSTASDCPGICWRSTSSLGCRAWHCSFPPGWGMNRDVEQTAVQLWCACGIWSNAKLPPIQSYAILFNPFLSYVYIHHLWTSNYHNLTLYIYFFIIHPNINLHNIYNMCIYIHIRRPLPSLGLGGAAPGITAGVPHCCLLRFASLKPAGGHLQMFKCGLPPKSLSMGVRSCQLARFKCSRAAAACHHAPKTLAKPASSRLRPFLTAKSPHLSGFETAPSTGFGLVWPPKSFFVGFRTCRRASWARRPSAPKDWKDVYAASSP